MAIRAPDGANKVCSRLVDVFRLFHVLPFSMFSQLSPCASIRDGRMAQFVEPCPVDLSTGETAYLALVS